MGLLRFEFAAITVTGVMPGADYTLAAETCHGATVARRWRFRGAGSILGQPLPQVSPSSSTTMRSRTVNMIERVNTVVIGAGQAGLSVSCCLRQRGIPHVVLEQERVGASWRRRWDSFTLVTPNAMAQLPRFAYGGDPGGFMQRDDVIGYLNAYAASFAAPLRVGVRVHMVTPRERGWTVHTSAHTFDCVNVVVATGSYQSPRLPACASALWHDIVQLHSADYRNAAMLPEGGVLVVGSGQSGAQIADDLERAGRRVHLSVGRAGRAPRTYRGRDVMEWFREFGMFDRPATALDSPAERFAANPHLSGRDGGCTLDLREFATRGMTLLGRVEWADGDRIRFADDLFDNLEGADRFADELCALIDERIEEAGINAPVSAPAQTPAASIPAPPRELSLRDAGIGTIIWATGYNFDFSWTGAPLDPWGYPVQQQGVTALDGLYFVGLHWLHRMKSGLLYGVGEDADHVTSHLAARTHPVMLV
jgi:putative flavoprotein involved in K+ transport